MRSYRLALAAILVSAMTAAAAANGRFPAATNVVFRRGDGAGTTIVLPLTFGLAVSSDDGERFFWICEAAVGYSGDYDPDYEVAADGTLYAGVYDALRISRDGGCSWHSAPAPLAGHWVSGVELGADGRVWAVTASTAMANDVFVSDDGGRSFRAANLAPDTGWLRSITVAPSDPKRAYVAGYRVSGAGGPTPLVYRTDDGGLSWTPLPTEGLRLGASSLVLFEAVSPTDANTVYARALGAAAPKGDVLYRSTDAGESFTEILVTNDTLTAFAVRADGRTLIAGSRSPCADDRLDGASKGCVRLSSDGGTSWRRAATEPAMGCVGERGDGTLFACGANWMPDFFALARSSDGDTWDRVMRFSDLAGPVSCPAGTVQFDICESLKWPSIREAYDIGAADAGPRPADASPASDRKRGGCGGCGVGLAAAVVAIPRRRRARGKAPAPGPSLRP
jgi:hypothetical protein